MTINPNQLSVTKIYPGNYVNVLRYWHEVRDVDQQPPSTNGPIMRNQPVGGPVGVVFQPGIIAQQAIGYVDLSFAMQGLGSQLEYYRVATTAANPFTSADIIIPSPDYHKDVREDITDGIQVPEDVYVYRASIRLSGGRVTSSGVSGSAASQALTLAPYLGAPQNGTLDGSGLLGVGITADKDFDGIAAGTTTIADGTSHEVTHMPGITTGSGQPLGGVAAGHKYRLLSTNSAGTAATAGFYDPRSAANFLAGDLKALAICEVCWMVEDQPPEREDLVLQPVGLTESQVYTRTNPRA